MRIRFRAFRVFALLAVILPNLVACSSYNVRFMYPRESRSQVFTDRPEVSLFVAEPEDLRPSSERQGSGFFGTLRFPADDKLDQPPSRIVMRSLLQDLDQTQVANLVRNPDNADYLLQSQLLSMTTELTRPIGAYAVPLAAGVTLGALGSVDGDGGYSHAIKTGLVGIVLGTMIPAPATVTGRVEVRLELRSRETNEVVWSSTCTGEYARDMHISLSSREDRRLAEEFLPRALKRANACAVGQLYAHLQGTVGEMQGTGSR